MTGRNFAKVFPRWAAAVALHCVLIFLGEANPQGVCIDDTSTFPSAQNTDFPFGGLFFDDDNQIACSGHVEAWHFCYFPPLQASETVYTVELSVYERDHAFNFIIYTQKPDSVYTANFTGSELYDDGDNCKTIPLPLNDRFNVVDEDFVGVYIGEIFSSNTSIRGLRDGNILDIIGTTEDETDSVKLRYSRCQSSSHTDLVLGCYGSVPQLQLQARVVFDYQSFISTGQATTSSTQTQTMDLSRTDTIQPTTTASRQGITSYQKFATNSQPIVATSQQTSARILNYQTSSQVIPTSTPSASLPINTQSRSVSPIVPAGVVGGGLILILLSAVIITLIVFIVMHRTRKAKLELMKWRKERRHIGMDHFVRVSEFHANTRGGEGLPPFPPQHEPFEELPESHEEQRQSYVPQPYEQLPQPYEDQTHSHVPQPYEDPLPENGYESPQPSTPFSNPTYKIEGDLVIQNRTSVGSQHSNCFSFVSTPRVDSYVLNSEPSNSEVTVSERMSAAGGHESSLSHVKRKPSIAPPHESELYEHYYKTLEEVKYPAHSQTCTAMPCDSFGKVNTVSTKEHFTSPATSEKDLLLQFEQAKLETIPSKEIKIISHLGSGQFGNVNRGIWKKNKGITDVAVKSFVDKMVTDSRVKLLQEAIIMGQFHNPNVISFYGMVKTKDRVMLVMELAAKGDLEHLLVSMVPDPGEVLAPDTNKGLLGFCQQVAFGMHYLSNKGFVHRDLAARNILVTQDNVLKIADFGMSKDLANEDYYLSQGGKIPVKWTAPEAINYKKYSTASDVWSYGCLLYEIWSLGQTPFRDYSNTEALGKLGTGYRLPPPPGCPRIIYDIMIRCWNPEPQQRTHFKVLIFELLEPESKILDIPEEALFSHQLAGNIGGPLEAGEQMYTDLQSKYCY